MMGQRVIVLGVAQDIGRRYEGRLIKVKKVLQTLKRYRQQFLGFFYESSHFNLKFTYSIL